MAHLLSRNRTKPRPGAPAARLRRIGVLLAGAITAGLLSAAPAAADPAPAAPIALVSVTATADDQLYALAADHSAVYRWNGKGTDWTKVGGPAQDLYAGGAGLFATSPGSGQLSKYNGQPDSWSQIGGAGADFAVTGDHLYGLNPDRTAVYEWNGQGTDWTKIGGPAQDLEAGGAGLFATSPDGELHKYDGQPDTWSEIGGAGADFAVTGDHLYGLNPDRTAVYEWNGTGTNWTKIGGPAQELYAGGAGLFATSPDKKIHRYSGQPERWAQAGEPGKAFTASNAHLYGLAPDGNSVHQWSGQGTAWTSLGAPSTPASPTAPPQPTEQAPPAAAPEPSDQTPPADEDGPEGKGPEPVEAGDAALTMAVTAKDDLYTLTPDHSALWRRSGSRWEQISGPAGSVYAGRAGVFITRPGTNTQISKYNDETRAWEPIVEANGSFAITGDHLYHLTPDGIGQWDGDTWTGIGGPAKNIYAGGAGLFATNPDTGNIYKYDGRPDQWIEVGGPGATFAVSDTHLYGLTPDRSAVYEWTGKDTDWILAGDSEESEDATGPEQPGGAVPAPASTPGPAKTAKYWNASIKCKASNPEFGVIPTRIGNGDLGWNHFTTRHNIRTCKPIEAALRGKVDKKDGARQEYLAEVVNERLRKRVEVVVIVQNGSRTRDQLYAVAPGEKIGVINAFCVNQPRNRCPDWINE
ncbi:hypothetical protein [Streptomyces sp. NPDC051364]|uniref:hypothetical protein n=1 Tax=Streptomyces sp. NPDC051364 TaxID=3155799 RepID=UPI0034249917